MDEKKEYMTPHIEGIVLDRVIMMVQHSSGKPPVIFHSADNSSYSRQAPEDNIYSTKTYLDE